MCTQTSQTGLKALPIIVFEQLRAYAISLQLFHYWKLRGWMQLQCAFTCVCAFMCVCLVSIVYGMTLKEHPTKDTFKLCTLFFLPQIILFLSLGLQMSDFCKKDGSPVTRTLLEE